MHDDTVSVSYGRIADRYEQARGGAERAEQLVAQIEPWLRGRTICDVGAGTGVVTERLQASDRTVLAIDVSIEMLRRAHDRLPGRVAVADGSDLPIATATIDTMTFVWVLHHVGDLDATLSEARRVLRPDGRVVAVSGLSVSAPNDEMKPIFERLNDELRPGRVRQAHSVADVARAVGFRLVHEGMARTTADVSPNGLADSIEQRLYSHLWDVEGNRWAAIVQPAVDELRALPDPDQARRRILDHPLVVLDR